MELAVAPGLRVVSIGPPDVVESSHLATRATDRAHGESSSEASRLSIRFTPFARDQNKVVLRLIGQQSVPHEGSIKLGLFRLEEAIPFHATYSLVAERGIALELEENSGRLRRATESTSGSGVTPSELPWASPRKDASTRPLLLEDDGNAPAVPIRITRQARSLSQETILTAGVLPRSIDVSQRTNLTVRHGSLSALEIQSAGGHRRPVGALG